MANRKRPIVLRCPVTAEERALIEQKMARLPTHLGHHLIQAFQPGEVTPEQTHEIGMELAREIPGGKYEFVLTTHIDRHHVHNHLIFNAVKIHSAPFKVEVTFSLHSGVFILSCLDERRYP